MKIKKNLVKVLFACTLMTPVMISCNDDDKIAPVYEIVVNPTLPEGYVIDSQIINFTEINTGVVTTTTDINNLQLAAGIYNIEANALVSSSEASGQKNMRAIAQNVVITETTRTISLDWFFYNPNNSLVISEIYLGSLNATGKGLLYDSHITIYNNTDETIYADGLAICEGTLNNATAYPDLTPTPEERFLVGTVYVIPGNGKEHPIEPGKSITIVDQAIEWSADVTGAQDYRHADFEWYDEVTIGTIRDTDNPDVPNLDKWYSYSATIWILSQQANRSYAIARIPEGITAESYLKDYSCSYTYYFTFTEKYMTRENQYYIPLDWIIDGVNLCPASTQEFLCLPPTIDISYKSINDDPQSASDRAYRMFVRREAGKSAEGNIILQDTDDSAKDFKIVNINTKEE
ncbi:MAG: DUF4876 domain-containing protein, partial [Muribaculaceae bacterium]|nr:DUF4876 domain-containing protein [Muribaculaceae bacterium]